MSKRVFVSCILLALWGNVAQAQNKIAPKVFQVASETRAQEAARSGKWEAAAQIYRQLANQTLDQKQRAQFLQSAQTASQNAKRMPKAEQIRALGEKGRALQKAPRFAEATAIYRQILRFPPMYWSAKATLDGSAPAAIVARERSSAHWNLGECLAFQSDYAGALKAFQTREPQPQIDIFLCGNAVIEGNYWRELWQNVCREGLGQRREAVLIDARLGLDSGFFRDATAARRLVTLYANSEQTADLKKWLDGVEAKNAQSQYPSTYTLRSLLALQDAKKTSNWTFLIKKLQSGEGKPSDLWMRSNSCEAEEAARFLAHFPQTTTPLLQRALEKARAGSAARRWIFFAFGLSKTAQSRAILQKQIEQLDENSSFDDAHELVYALWLHGAAGRPILEKLEKTEDYPAQIYLESWKKGEPLTQGGIRTIPFPKTTKDALPTARELSAANTN